MSRRPRPHPWVWMFTIGIAVVSFATGALFLGVILLAAAVWMIARQG